MRAAFAAAGLASLAGCAHVPAVSSAISLDAQLSFTDPSLCDTSEPHARLLNGMVEGDANVGFRAGPVLALPGAKSAFGRVKVKRHDGWWTVSVPVRGSLFGLSLVRIIQSLPEGGDPGDVTYVFAARVGEVERALRARRFPARAGKEVQLGPPDGYAHLMTLLPDPKDGRRTVFGCGYS